MPLRTLFLRGTLRGALHGGRALHLLAPSSQGLLFAGGCLNSSAKYLLKQGFIALDGLEGNAALSVCQDQHGVAGRNGKHVANFFRDHNLALGAHFSR